MLGKEAPEPWQGAGDRDADQRESGGEDLPTVIENHAVVSESEQRSA